MGKKYLGHLHVHDHEIKSNETEKNILFPGKVSDSVLIQLEMVHNLLQMFKMQAIQRDTTRKETTVRIYEKKWPLYCLTSDIFF